MQATPTLWRTLGCWAAVLQAVALFAQAPARAAEPAPQPNPVRSIELPHLDPELAVAPGRDEFMMVCVGCHSPRYVMMQPRFNERQWTDTVDKMAKTFGAQMDAGQRQAIIGYLVATHGPNSAPLPSSNNDDDFSAPPPAQAAPTEEVIPSLPVPEGGDELASAIERGAALFAQYCAGCHGPKGHGDGPVAPVLFRKPKNLASTRFSVSLLSQVLWNGKRGTAMPSWRSLSEVDRAALAAYVQSLHEPVPLIATPKDALAQGSQVFLQNCAPCHGETGDGSGLAAASLLPRPANFKVKQPNPDYILETLREGIPGTAMPSWKELISETDRQALADFVRSLYQGKGETGGAKPAVSP